MFELPVRATFRPASLVPMLRAVGWLGKGWRALRQARRNRITSETLRRLDDRMLRDIGLARDEIDSAVRSGALQRPAALLDRPRF